MLGGWNVWERVRLLLEQRAAQAAKKYHPYLEYTSRLDTYIHTSKRIKIQHQKKSLLPWSGCWQAEVGWSKDITRSGWDGWTGEEATQLVVLRVFPCATLTAPDRRITVPPHADAAKATGLDWPWHGLHRACCISIHRSPRHTVMLPRDWVCGLTDLGRKINLTVNFSILFAWRMRMNFWEGENHYQ